MDNKDKQAFAAIATDGNEIYRQSGLTKREYFAAMAMQGLLTDYFNNGQYGNHVNYPMVSEISVRCADDLLAELEK